MMRCAWTGVTCNEVLTPKTPNGHGLSNNAVAAFRECPLIPPTVRTQRDGYAEPESDQKPFLTLRNSLKTEKSCFRRIIGNGYVHDCHHKIELTKTVILKEKLTPNSTWSRRKSRKTPKNSNRRIDRNGKILKLQTGFGSRQGGHFALSDAS